MHTFFSEIAEDPGFREAPTFREQCRIVFSRGPGVPFSQVAKFFGVDGNSIRDQHRKLEKMPKANGRPPILNPDQVHNVMAFIQDRVRCSDPATVNDCLNFILDNFNIAMLPDTFRKWINRSTCFATVEGHPMEQKRLEVTSADIERYFDTLHQALVGVPAALVFNLDESGFQRYADARNQVIIVEKGSQSQHFAVNRSERRATFLAVVSADGRTVKPLVILPRSTIENEVLLAGYTEDQVVLAHSPKGFITTEIFTRYLDEVLIPTINYRRWELSYQGPAVIIMDNCSCHGSDRITNIFEAANVRFVPLPPHSSDQLQPLDVGLFGNMKAAQSRVHVPEQMSPQSRQVIRILSAFQATFHPMAVTSAFRRAGVSLRLEYGRLFCCVTPSTCSALRGPAPEREDEPHCERFDKGRVEVDEGHWGRRADSLLEFAGLNPCTGEVADLPNVPAELEQWDRPTHLSETINVLWNGVLPMDDEDDDDDPDYSPDPDRQEAMPQVTLPHVPWQAGIFPFGVAFPMISYPQQSQGTVIQGQWRGS